MVEYKRGEGCAVLYVHVAINYEQSCCWDGKCVLSESYKWLQLSHFKGSTAHINHVHTRCL